MHMKIHIQTYIYTHIYSHIYVHKCVLPYNHMHRYIHTMKHINIPETFTDICAQTLGHTITREHIQTDTQEQS